MLTGSGSVGARFGTSIANLEDIDGDGFNGMLINSIINETTKKIFKKLIFE